METAIRYFHGTDVERETIGRLPDREGDRIHGWSRIFDGDGYEFDAENIGLNKDGTEIECKNEGE